MLVELMKGHLELVKKGISNKPMQQVKADCLSYMSELDVEEATEESTE